MFEPFPNPGPEKRLYPTYVVEQSPGLIVVLTLRIEGNKGQFNTWIAVASSHTFDPDRTRFGHPGSDRIEQGSDFPRCHLWPSGQRADPLVVRP